jgi:hypothetical protein
MKHLLLTISFLVPLFLSAQNKNKEAQNIDAEVSKIDKSASTTIQQLQASDKHYTYALAHGKVIFLTVKYKTDSTDYEEEYYLDKENLIYAKEKETKKGVTWEGHFYFSNWKLIYKETFGHGKTESKDWDPEKEILKKYDLRINELKPRIK